MNEFFIDDLRRRHGLCGKMYDDQYNRRLVFQEIGGLKAFDYDGNPIEALSDRDQSIYTASFNFLS